MSASQRTHHLSDRRLAQRHLVLTRVLLTAVAVQVLLALIGLPLPIHQLFGLCIGAGGLGLVLIARAGHLSRTTTRLSMAVLGLLLLQPILIFAGTRADIFNALHGANGVLIVTVTVILSLHEQDEYAATQREDYPPAS